MTYDQWKDPTPDGPTPEEEAAMAAADECQRCNGTGRIEVFHCEGNCDCGLCPGLDDCPECCGQIETDDVYEEEMDQLRYGKLPPA